MTATETPETITRDELAEALRGLKITPEDENTFYPAIADAVFERAKRNREPEWRHGDMVLDARNDVWMWNARSIDLGGSGGWEAPGVSGRVGAAVPARPLRKLLPEWFPHVPDAVAIAKIIYDWTDARHDALEAAERIRRLIMEEAL